MKRRAKAACLIALALSACRETRETGTPRNMPSDSTATARLPRPYRPGIRFDPQTIRPGTPVGVLIANSVNAQRTAIDSTYVGVARFLGSIELSGWTFRHPDADLKAVASCFEADSASGSRLPRWSGDERRPWFCFQNGDAAARVLGPPSEGIPATIVIDNFTIHRGLSDEVNSARFLRQVRAGAAAYPPAG